LANERITPVLAGIAGVRVFLPSSNSTTQSFTTWPRRNTVPVSATSGLSQRELAYFAGGERERLRCPLESVERAEVVAGVERFEGEAALCLDPGDTGG
jgi:hypothetical protein